MSYGFKAYSTIDNNHLVVDDSFSSWNVVQQGVLPSNGSAFNLTTSFPETSSTPPALFVKVPSGGTYFVNSSIFFGTTVGTVNQVVVSCDTSLGNSLQGANYRLYRQTNLTSASVNTGYGLNVFNQSSQPVFSSNFVPLVFDGAGIADTGKSQLDFSQFPSSGYYGNEVNTNAFEPYVFLSFSAKQSIIPAPANQRRIQTLLAVMYHTSGTLRIRFYNSVIVIPQQPPIYIYTAYPGTTINQTFFWFSGTRPA